MKKIGLLGGVSWVSTLDYYRYINEGIDERLGGLNFAECISYTPLPKESKPTSRYR